MDHESVRFVLEHILGKIERIRPKTFAGLKSISFSAGEIVTETGYSRATVYRVLRMLSRAGIMENKGKFWKLNKRLISIFELCQENFHL